MELWQLDIVGRIRLADGTRLSAVTGIDDHSRFCVLAKLLERATARPVCDAPREALARHGAPQAILTDIHPEWRADRACGVRPAA
jgi:hypothetical protein